MSASENIAASKRERTCVSCGNKQGKAALLRIVRSADGVQLDLSGRVAGRGAYVCGQECFEAAVSRGKLARALRCQLSTSDYERVRTELVRALCEHD